MKYLFVLLFSAIWFSACRDNSSEGSQDVLVPLKDSTERLDTVFSTENISFLNQLGFSQYASSQSAPVDWSKFSMVSSSHDTLLVSRFEPEQSYYEQYGKLLKYSPDSSMFIDLDSYNVEVQKDKNARLFPVEKGPDTEVSLISRVSKEKTRLVFLGPGNAIEEAGWIDNDNLLLIGFHEADTTKTKTAIIWRYHIPTKTFHIYESRDSSIPVTLLNWRKERFRKLRADP